MKIFPRDFILIHLNNSVIGEIVYFDREFVLNPKQVRGNKEGKGMVPEKRQGGLIEYYLCTFPDVSQTKKKGIALIFRWEGKNGAVGGSATVVLPISAQQGPVLRLIQRKFSINRGIPFHGNGFQRPSFI